ncbi:MAG: sulfite exporter TauE/SafE family protein [Desulforhopalus sp.]
MVFQTAGIEIAPWIPPLIAFVISFFTSMGGVSGAFLLLPFQMSFLGYTSPSVSATNQLFNIVAIPSGVYKYWKEGRMVWPLTWIVIAGTLPGVLLGAIVRIRYLPDPQKFKVFAAAVLLYISLAMIRDLLGKNNPIKNKVQSEKKFREVVKLHRTGKEGNKHLHSSDPSVVRLTHFNLRRFGYTFYDEQFDVSTPGIFSLSLIVGVIGGIYGIGGGAIIAPFFVTFFNLPVHTIAGATLMGTFVTSIAGVAFYQAIAPFYPNISVAPDWLLGLLFGSGGMAGMYFGAQCQKYVPSKAIKWMLAGIIVFIAIRYAVGA